MQVLQIMHIRKVDKRQGMFRIVVPHQIVSRRMWNDVEYVIIDDVDPETVMVRRLVNGAKGKAELESDPDPGN